MNNYVNITIPDNHTSKITMAYENDLSKETQEEIDKSSTEDMKEKQYLFDKSLNHIRKQGKPSIATHEKTDMTECRYHGEDNTGCGAAPFINSYLPMMEGKSFYVLANDECDNNLKPRFRDLLDPIAIKHVMFVGHLQGAHDGAAGIRFRNNTTSFMEDYEHRMEQIAHRFKLKYTAPL